MICLFQNVSIGIVGKDMEFTIYDDDDVAPYLEGLEERPQRKVIMSSTCNYSIRAIFISSNCKSVETFNSYFCQVKVASKKKRPKTRIACFVFSCYFFQVALLSQGPTEASYGPKLTLRVTKRY